METHYHIIGDIEFGKRIEIMNGAVIGKRFRRFLDGSYEDVTEKTSIGDDVFVGYYSIIGNGSNISEGVIVDDNCMIESCVSIGRKTLVIYKAQICSYVTIGSDCVIGGFVGEGTTVGNNCRIFGSIVHSQHQPMNDWDAESSIEKSPIINDKVFVGFNSTVSAPVTIGPNAYICAGSIITIDVPQGYIGYGTNLIKHHSEWNGDLRNSKIFV